MYYPPLDFSILKGKTFLSVTMSEGKDEINFVNDLEHYQLAHEQCCCESVRVEDICGDLQDLVGSEILGAEESTNQDNPPEYCESFTWTFYRIHTAKGSVVIRWLGESNGYYSEDVQLRKIG